jgi:hypothetical protein
MPLKKIQMADENIIDNGRSPGHTNKKTRLTVEERKQLVASLLIGSTWHNETPKLSPQAVVCVAKTFTKHVSTIHSVSESKHRKTSHNLGSLQLLQSSQQGDQDCTIPLTLPEELLTRWHIIYEDLFLVLQQVWQCQKVPCIGSNLDMVGINHASSPIQVPF